jgi:hypothetical protein
MLQELRSFILRSEDFHLLEFMSYSLVDIYRRSSKAAENLYQTKRRHIPYDGNLHSNCCEGLRLAKFKIKLFT